MPVIVDVLMRIIGPNLSFVKPKRGFLIQARFSALRRILCQTSLVAARDARSF